MRTQYNRIAGQDLGRLATLADGVFAIAMTLLVLDLRAPASDAIRGEHDLWRALVALLPHLEAYGMSFLTLGIFWVGHQTQFDHFARSDRHLAWINIGFLAAVSLMPFSTALLAEFITYRLALAVYWLNLLLLGVASFGARRYAARAGLVKDDVTRAMSAAVERRIVIAQALYALAALLCLVSTYVSIAVIVLVQLNYALAPRIRPLDRI